MNRPRERRAGRAVAVAAPWFCLTALAGICLTALAAGCQNGATDAATRTASWPADCRSLARPDSLGMDGAREAHRRAARRHELRLREAAAPGSFLRGVRGAIEPERMASGGVCLADIADWGELVFEHEYGFADGLGGGDGASSPRGPFRRVHEGLFGGPETISCASCHWVGGPHGAGAETDNAILIGDGDRVGSGDARNPQALLGLGVVQALAREMTSELQRRRAELTSGGAGAEVRLVTKGVDFGVLRLAADGTVDTSGVRGIDADLVVKPFGWKGNFAEIADFAADALQVHLGVQSERLGVASEDEIGAAAFTALVAHLALLELPIVAPLVQKHDLGPAATGLIAPTTSSFAEDFARGRQIFHEIGCAGCHVPMMVLEEPNLTLDGLPEIDLATSMREPALRSDEALGGYPVWLFSDLKRHDMGEGNAARHPQRGVPRRDYMTPRLWGVADSAPYLHDGRAPSFDYAIGGHDGEAAAARAAFTELSREAQGSLRVYLMSLRRESRLIVP